MVQKYIEQPLLIDGRKFDIRSYCLITPDHKIHMYKHSYIRTSSTAFDLSNLEDRQVTHRIVFLFVLHQLAINVQVTLVFEGLDAVKA